MALGKRRQGGCFKKKSIGQCMAKKYNFGLIQVKESYSPREMAQLFGIDTKTPLRWIKDGLPVIAKNTNPLLVMGSDLKVFVIKMRQKRKLVLKKDEFYCVKCQRATTGKMGSVETVKTGKTIGKNRSEQWKIIGACEFCNGKLNRFIGVCQKD